MSGPPITLISIAAHAHSGSTLLDQMLGAHEQVVSLGEFARYRTHKPRRCACGAKTTDACTFWSRVEQVLTRDAGLTLGELELRDWRAPDFAAHNLAVMRALTEVSGKRVFVDSTKSSARLCGLVAMREPEIRLLPVHLIRGAHGVVCSHARKEGGWLGHALNYAREMVRYRAVLRHSDYVRVRYERLCAEPRAQLQRILDRVDLAYDEQRQPEWATQEHHNLGGNRMRKRRDNTIRLDERWREVFNGPQRWTIAALTRWSMPSEDVKSAR